MDQLKNIKNNLDDRNVILIKKIFTRFKYLHFSRRLIIIENCLFWIMFSKMA